MHKRIKLIVLILLMTMMTSQYFVMQAETNVLPEEIFETEAIDGGLAITGFKNELLEGPYTNAQFPDTIEDQKVLEIKEYAFKNDTQLQGSLKLGEHVKHIGFNAFSRASITKLEAENVESLGGWSLEYNDNLKEIVLPSLQKYEEGDFAGLKLDYLNLGHVEVLEKSAYFSKEIKNLDAPGLVEIKDQVLNKKSLESIDAPNLQKVGVDALANNPLKKVNLTSLEIVDKYGFWGSFKEVKGDGSTEDYKIELVLPNLKEIGEEAFKQTGLKSLQAPSLEKIGSRAFQYSSSLSSLSTNNMPEMDSVREVFLGSGFEESYSNKVFIFPLYIQNEEENKILDVRYSGHSTTLTVVNPDGKKLLEQYTFVAPLEAGDDYYNFALGKDFEDNPFFCVDLNRALYEGFFEEVSVEGNIYILEFGYNSKYHEEFNRRYNEKVEEIMAIDDIDDEEREKKKAEAYEQIYQELTSYRESEEAKEKQQSVTFEKPSSSDFLYAYDSKLLSSVIYHAEQVLKENPLSIETDEDGNDVVVGPVLIHLIASNEELADVMMHEDDKVLTRDNFRSLIEKTLLYDMTEKVYGEERLNLILDRVENDSDSYTDLKYYLPLDPNGIAYLNQSLVRPGEPMVNILVEKEWIGGDASHRPQITVELYQNGEKIDETELSEDNNWTYMWEDLEKFDQEGNEYLYTVEELVPEGYVEKVEETKEGFKIINTYQTPKKPDKPTPEDPDEPTPEKPNEPTPEDPDEPTPEDPVKSENVKPFVPKLPATGMDAPFIKYGLVTFVLGMYLLVLNRKDQ